MNLSIPFFWPQLQLADGSYVGTEGSSDGEIATDPVLTQSSETVADVSAGGVVWERGFSSPVLPLYATDDGNVTVTSTQYSEETTTLPGTIQQLGTLYTLDPSGNVVSQSAGTGAVPSWTNQWYVDPPETVSSVVEPAIGLAPTFAAIIGGNHSGNGTAIDQVQAQYPQQTSHQLPPSGSTLHTNYNSIEIYTTLSPDFVFSHYVQTFAAAMPDTNDVASTVRGTNVTAAGQRITFTLDGPMALGQGPFSVESERVDPMADILSVVTLVGHPLAGWRYWRVYQAGPNDIVVETAAIDTNGPGILNWAGYWLFRPQQIKMWKEYMEYILFNIRSFDHNAVEGGNPFYNIVNGLWDPASPTHNQILNEVCQSAHCN